MMKRIKVPANKTEKNLIFSGTLLYAHRQRAHNELCFNPFKSVQFILSFDHTVKDIECY